jgi:hypothetical protein
MSNSLYDSLRTNQALRDKFLEQVQFVHHPRVFRIFEEGNEHSFGDEMIVNYSQLYGMLAPETKSRFPFPRSDQICSGDMIDLACYRGVGVYFALWMVKDMIFHPAEFVKRFEDEISGAGPYTLVERNMKEYDLEEYQLDEQQWIRLAKALALDNWKEKFDEICDDQFLFQDIERSEHFRNWIVSMYDSRGRDSFYPALIPRHILSGKMDEDKCHLYLFCHLDEFGYLAPTAFSSLRTGYFLREYNSIAIDPLLTHSCSFFGYLIRESENNRDLDNMIGVSYDQSDSMKFEEIEWVNIKKGNMKVSSSASALEYNFFQKTREMFFRHFKWLAQMMPQPQ